LEALLDSREHLNAYSEAVNTPIGESGVTPFRAFGELLRLNERLKGKTVPRLDIQSWAGWSGTEFRKWLERVEELQTFLKRAGVPTHHPFWGSRYKVSLAADRREIREECQAAGRAVHNLQQLSAQLATVLKLPAPETRQAVIHFSQAAERVLTAPSLEQIKIKSREWISRADDVESTLEAGDRISRLRNRYDQWLLPEAWDQDVLQIRKAYVSHGRKFWRILSGTFRRAKSELAGLCRGDLPKSVGEQQKMVEAILEVRRLQPTLDENDALLSQLLGARWQGLDSEWARLHVDVTWVSEVYKQIKARVFPPALIDYLDATPDFSALRAAHSAVESALDAHASAIEIIVKRVQLDEEIRFGNRDRLIAQPFSDQLRIVGSWYKNVGRLQEIVVYNHWVAEATKSGLMEVVEIASTWPKANLYLVDLIKRAWYETLVARAIEERPILATFNAETHLRRIERFCEADQLSFQINRTHLAHKHWNQLPRHTGPGQLGILLREFEKKRRHLPIRQLMTSAGHAIQTIKPVFMMSPPSIAMFLPPESLHFDLVVFDEASQVRPVEAFGAILRGEQAVVVGDSKQLPPTNFFNQIVELDEEFESATADLESVLGLFLAQGAPQRMLRWHYRSQHESLITVSNYEFYDNKLVVFPSPDAQKEEVGVAFHHLPNTVYDRGRSRANHQEAQAVAKAVMEHARTRPDLTLGVAAFSISQMQAIQDQLELLRRRDPSYEAFFASHTTEPFFIKNLENVQGDERDVIYISVGYGRSADGHLTMNFGPLNKEGGERRLNVLITRARRRCEIFSNLTADDIDLSRTDARGVVALKRYLKYVETGHLDLPVPTGDEPDSPFEEEVARALSQQGYEVEAQVGSAGFRIDLAVKDKERPGRYLLGIECDGATYHSARSARDRDRLRQEVLKNIGWQIHRIWSTDWFRDPGRELRRTIEAIEAAKTKNPPGRSPSNPSPPSPPANQQPIERHEAVAVPVEFQAEDYRLANLSVFTHHDLHEVAPGQMAEWIRRVVDAESPVHIDLVARRITDAIGVKRIGHRIRTAIEDGVAHAARAGAIQRRSDFLWKSGMTKAPVVRSHANVLGFTRKIDQIAPEEIKLAIETVVQEALGIQREDIPPAVCSLLGFGRASQDMRGHVDELISQMLLQRELKIRGNSLLVE
jgi:very-short-patch-repair endonuclease